MIAGVLCVQAVLIGAGQSGKLCLTPGDDPSLGDCLLQAELKRRTSDGLLAIGIGLLSDAVTAAVAGVVCLRQPRSDR